MTKVPTKDELITLCEDWLLSAGRSREAITALAQLPAEVLAHRLAWARDLFGWRIERGRGTGVHPGYTLADLTEAMRVAAERARSLPGGA